MSRRRSHPSLFRIVLAALLALGLCLQPVLAAACDVEDVRVALDGGGPALSGLHDDGAGSAGDCCANPACGDCCLHATATLPAAIVATVPVLRIGGVMPPRTDFRPSDYPVDVRPPIAS